MIRLTLAQMRRSISRLTAAGIAITLGAAFVAATLIAGNVIQRGTFDSVAAGLGHADLVVDVYYGDATALNPATLEEMAAVEGVSTLAPLYEAYQEFRSDTATASLYVLAAKGDPSLEAQTVVSGTMPTGPGEIALPVEAATRFDVELGDTLQAPLTYFDGVERIVTSKSASLEVVGMLDDPYNAYAAQGGAAIVTADELFAWDGSPEGQAAIDEAIGDDAIDPRTTWQATIALADGASLDEARDALTQILDARDIDADVLTKDEQARALTSSLTGGDDVLTTLVLVFAGLALLVAGLVISNTFQVLVAQRARTLALLRCVGANKRQLRQSVLLEASIVGLSASLLGVVVGAAVAQLSLSLIGSTNTGIPLTSWIIVTPSVVLVPVLAGLLVTIGAALSPARAATRVSPLAALRPLEQPALRSKAGRVRFTFAMLMVLGGAGLMAAGVLQSREGDAELGLIAAFAGGVFSVIGLLISTAFWIPRVTAMVGHVLAKRGPTSRLAAANSLRNPRRTAATSTALLIGVTLVVTMATGAASARVVLMSELGDYYPVDVTVSGAATFSSVEGEEGASATGLDPALLNTVGAVDGVAAVAPVTTGFVWDNRNEMTTSIVGVDPDLAVQTLANPEILAGLDEDTVLATPGWMENEGLRDGDELSFSTPVDGETPGGTNDVALTVRASTLAQDGFVVTTTTLEGLAPATALDGAWIGLVPGTDEFTVTADVKDVFAEASVWVSGAAVERAGLEEIIDTMLAVVVGLLAVAVVIALIGVTNTLSLSVLERQRESATLRAIGLTKKQLRSSLAIEGLLITLVGSGLGMVLGLIYGWTGAAAALGIIGDAPLVVPWRDVGLVVVVAVVAGLLASVLPARRAARTSPVAALGAE